MPCVPDAVPGFVTKVPARSPNKSKPLAPQAACFTNACRCTLAAVTSSKNASSKTAAACRLFQKVLQLMEGNAPNCVIHLQRVLQTAQNVVKALLLEYLLPASRWPLDLCKALFDGQLRHNTAQLHLQ